MEWKAATPAGTARDSRPRRSLRRGGSSRAMDARPPGTEYAVKSVFWQRANFKVDCYVGNLKRTYIVIDKKTIL